MGSFCTYLRIGSLCFWSERVLWTGSLPRCEEGTWRYPWKHLVSPGEEQGGCEALYWCFRALSIVQESRFSQWPVTPLEIYLKGFHLSFHLLSHLERHPSLSLLLFLWPRTAAEAAETYWEQALVSHVNHSYEKSHRPPSNPLVLLPGWWELGIHLGAWGFPVFCQYKCCISF